jgi:hypothetical protein
LDERFEALEKRVSALEEARQAKATSPSPGQEEELEKSKTRMLYHLTHNFNFTGTVQDLHKLGLVSDPFLCTVVNLKIEAEDLLRKVLSNWDGSISYATERSSEHFVASIISGRLNLQFIQYAASCHKSDFWL